MPTAVVSTAASRHQWSIPEATRLYAAADGRVVWASKDWPFYCSTRDEIVDDQEFLAIAHNTDADEGKTQTFATVYKHVSSIVAGLSLGDSVTAGQLIGFPAAPDAAPNPTSSSASGPLAGTRPWTSSTASACESIRMAGRGSSTTGLILLLMCSSGR